MLLNLPEAYSERANVVQYLVSHVADIAIFVSNYIEESEMHFVISELWNYAERHKIVDNMKIGEGFKADFDQNYRIKIVKIDQYHYKLRIEFAEDKFGTYQKNLLDGIVSFLSPDTEFEIFEYSPQFNDRTLEFIPPNILSKYDVKEAM